MKPSESLLHRDVETLVDLLGTVVAEQAGDELVATLREICQLARQRRSGLDGAETRLAAAIHSLSETQLFGLVRALSVFFDLANLAEDCQRVRVLHQRERDQYPSPRSESIGAAIARLKKQGIDAAGMQR
ncbi:MAG TPA: phosphoenolpyruvate carboxylase, partial [Pirellulaceae bacterium]|nr:phosphoenolpyruvate carboxylase [Pirellulaceae bacterium]